MLTPHLVEGGVMSDQEYNRMIFDEDGDRLKAHNDAHPPTDDFLKNFVILLNNFRVPRLHNSMLDGCYERSGGGSHE